MYEGFVRVARWQIFKPKILTWVNFGGACNGSGWSILWPFGLFYSHLVYFRAIWYSLCLFGIFWYVVRRKILQSWVLCCVLLLRRAQKVKDDKIKKRNEKIGNGKKMSCALLRKETRPSCRLLPDCSTVAILYICTYTRNTNFGILWEVLENSVIFLYGHLVYIFLGHLA
jgi:hypothetical protein